MNLLEALLLGLVQGLTEFLPVSSSGHLLLAHHFLGEQEQALAFDVALHIGTLLALVIFFWRDVIELASAVLQRGPKARLGWFIALATVPAVIAGVLLQDAAESTFRSPLLVSATLIAVAVLMLIAERVNRRRQAGTELQAVSWWQALAIGTAQAVALIPGVSRSGSTITTGLFAGLTRVAATRFSFLLSIPITFGAILKVLSGAEVRADVAAQPAVFAVGILAALVSGSVAIKFLLKFVAKHSLDVFAYYRIALGIVVLLTLLF